MVQNNHGSGYKYWATCSFTRTAHLFASSTLLAAFRRLFIHSRAHSLTSELVEKCDYIRLSWFLNQSASLVLCVFSQCRSHTDHVFGDGNPPGRLDGHFGDVVLSKAEDLALTFVRQTKGIPRQLNRASLTARRPVARRPAYGEEGKGWMVRGD